MYDDDIDPSYGDADLELVEMHRQADEARAGEECPHWSSVGYLKPPVYPEQVGLKPGERYCRNCRRAFSDDPSDRATRD